MSPSEMLTSNEPPLPFKVLLKRVGTFLAWGVAIVVGIQNTGEGDLLELVLRAGAVWLGVWVIWSVGLTMMDRLIAAELADKEPTQQLDTEKAEDTE